VAAVAVVAVVEPAAAAVFFRLSVVGVDLVAARLPKRSRLLATLRRLQMPSPFC